MFGRCVWQRNRAPRGLATVERHDHSIGGHGARSSGRKGIREHFDSLMKRFPGVKDRTRIRREVQLQALWFYANNPEARRRWRGRWGQPQSSRDQHAPTTKARTMPVLLVSVGRDASSHFTKEWLGVLDGARDIERALELEPEHRHDACRYALSHRARWAEVGHQTQFASFISSWPRTTGIARSPISLLAPFAPYGGKREERPRDGGTGQRRGCVGRDERADRSRASRRVSLQTTGRPC